MIPGSNPATPTSGEQHELRLPPQVSSDGRHVHVLVVGYTSTNDLVSRTILVMGIQEPVPCALCPVPCAFKLNAAPDYTSDYNPDCASDYAP